MLGAAQPTQDDDSTAHGTVLLFPVLQLAVENGELFSDGGDLVIDACFKGAVPLVSVVLQLTGEM